MINFKSIVVLDTETTSLPQNDHNTSRVTELAVLGCEIEHLKGSQELPRVLHKLVLLFNPKKKIDIGATQVSGLCNELLMNVKGFTEEDAETFKHFIDRLPQPACIVAHNGKNFDFPILRRALHNLNQNLPNNVYCADTLEAFRELLPKSENSLQIKCSDMRTLNETTPKHQKTTSVNHLNYKPSAARRLFQHDPSSTPGDEELFPNNQELSEWVSTQDSSDLMDGKVCVRPKSYSLKDVYYFFFGGYFLNSHRAEEDSKALLLCMMRCNGFWNWLNKNAIVFNSVPPLF